MFQAANQKIVLPTCQKPDREGGPHSQALTDEEIGGETFVLNAYADRYNRRPCLRAGF